MTGQPALPLAAYAVHLAGPADFDGWRDAARRLSTNEVKPEDIEWHVGGEGDELPAPTPGVELRVSRDFIERAAIVTCHSDSERFALLYRLLWRQRSEPHLLRIASDPDVRRFEAMEKSVRRDEHKMHAFVRFRKIGDGDEERFVAWFEPDHFILELAAPFFVRRFTGMHWAILTPHGSAEWDRERLALGPGASKDDAPAADQSEEMWRTYFASIFNPARLKVKAMQAEMPKKYWRNLPEASLIPELISGADAAAREMIARMPTMPAAHHQAIQARHWPALEPSPETEAHSIDALRQQASQCRRCPLWSEATQTVFGEGSDNAELVFVGEQPGDQEDLQGRPFVGPAGKIFDAVLGEAGIERTAVYVTNAVKHFKFEPRGKRRIHSKPNAGEVQACRWWLAQEVTLLKPKLMVALGATAAQSLLEAPVAITKQRGQTIKRDDGLAVFLTIHPSYILRIRDPQEAAAERARFVADIRTVRAMMAG